ncbi:CPBP family intramembrane glutamic endopeptidase [Chitinophaga sp. Hz27]|uniref:CPBP family intramembrane glutamic endopeptidase n=1 Tax=Chitinophaga sp. Hz27 TaxID=3347169 RepID=UPI0035D7D2A2
MSAFQDSNNKLTTLFRVLLFYISSTVIFIGSSILVKLLPPRMANYLSLFLSAVLTLLLVHLFAKWENIRLTNTGVVPGNKSILRFLAGIGIGLMLPLIQALILVGYGHLTLVRINDISGTQMLAAGLLYLLVATREELVFRSYALRRLNQQLGSSVAVAIITVIFIAEHIIAGMPWLVAIIGSGLGAVLFGIAALKTKGLALPLGLHAAWNFGQWSLGFKGEPGIWKALTASGYEQQMQQVGLGAFVVAMLSGILLVLILYRKMPVQETN